MTIRKTIFHVMIPLGFETSNFSQLIPLKEEKSVTRKELLKMDEAQRAVDKKIWFQYCFSPGVISRTFQLEGSPLLDDGNDALVRRFDLAQVHRETIGLHKNENCEYFFVKDSICFQIKKVRIWFFRWGTAFLTVEVCKDHLTEEDALNLTARICSVQSKIVISYKKATGKNQYETKSFTIKEVIDRFLNLQTYIRLYPYPNETYKKAYCLFYGIVNETEESSFPVFLEMLRLQRKSNMRPGCGVKEENLYSPYEYIHWTFAENMLAVIGDLKKGGPENDHFLQDAGGLQKTVFHNYMLLYVYYLSINLCAKQAEKKCKNAEKTGSSRLQIEVVQQLMCFNDIPMRKLSSETHINRLFEDYLCDNVWGLHALLEKLDRQYLPSIIKHKPCDVFISYRRKGGFYPARLLFTLLEERHKKPFLDVERLGSGRFDEHIYEMIEKCDAILIILTDGCLDGCADEGDWMRREIEKALEMKARKNIKIIPVMIDGFEFPEYIPEAIDISRENAIRFTPQSFRGDFETLCSFLDE